MASDTTISPANGRKPAKTGATKSAASKGGASRAATATRTRVWLSYDMGIRGDYEGLYRFLDMHGAKECGDSVAMFDFDFRSDPAAELAGRLKENVTVDHRSRMYAVYRDGAGKWKGKFLFGGRKAPPWAGYGNVRTEEEDGVDE